MASFDDFSRNLILQDGIWRASGQINDVSYPMEASDLYFKIEENSFWFRHRNRIILEAIIKYSSGGNILDIGGGNGFVSDYLTKNGFETILVEPNTNGCLNGLRRGLHNIINCDFDLNYFRAGSVSNICFFDVLEHVDDHTGFLEIAREVLTPKGRLFITVPAYDWLWSMEDKLVGHYRRYNEKQLHAIIARSGFKKVYSTYFFSFLVIPLLLFRTLPYKIGCAGLLTESKRPLHSINTFKNLLITPALNFEVNQLRKSSKTLFGSSLMFVASKE